MENRDVKMLCWFINNLGMTETMIMELIDKGAFVDNPLDLRDELLASLTYPQTIVEELLEFIDIKELTEIFKKDFNEYDDLHEEILNASKFLLHEFNRKSYYSDELSEKLAIALLKNPNELSISKISRLSDFSRKEVRKIKDKLRL